MCARCQHAPVARHSHVLCADAFVTPAQMKYSYTQSHASRTDWRERQRRDARVRSVSYVRFSSHTPPTKLGRRRGLRAPVANATRYCILCECVCNAIETCALVTTTPCVERVFYASHAGCGCERAQGRYIERARAHKRTQGNAVVRIGFYLFTRAHARSHTTTRRSCCIICGTRHCGGFAQ